MLSHESGEQYISLASRAVLALAARADVFVTKSTYIILVTTIITVRDIQ